MGTGTVETRWQRKDGTILEVLLSSTPVHPEDWSAGVTFTALDITERKRSEEMLIRIRKAVECASDAIGMADAQGRHFYQNKAFTDLFEYTTEEVNATDGKPAGYVDKNAAREVFATITSGGSWSGEVQMKSKSGRRFAVQVRADAIKDEDGRVIGLVGVHTDITERKRAEASLLQMAHVSAVSSDYVVLIGSDFRYLFANDGYLKARRLRPEEIVGHHMREIVGPERFEQLGRPQVEAGLRGEEVEAFEWSDFGEGNLRFLHVRVTPFREADGTISGVVMSGRDITERKRAEEEREKLQSQLTQAQKMQSVGRLAGGVAHDFNNMLQVISGNVSLALLDLPVDSPVRDSLLEVQKSAQRSADLTRQLLAFARKQTIAPKVLDLNDTLAGMLKMLRRLIGEDINLSWMPGANLWPVKLDPSQIDQVLANLCVNARDAIGGVGTVTIETTNVTLDDTYVQSHPECVPGEYVMLAVSDTGKGMDFETRSHLFEPFFTTKEQGKGTGLGLATVFGIVKQNLGLISVYSEPGQGTTFKLYLPRAEAQEIAAVAVARKKDLRGTETILLVEDEDQILVLAKRILQQHGYTVLASRSPEAALKLAEQHSGRIHLLITDVVMPGMNGRELRQRLAALQPELRCLYMSGYTANVIAHHGVLDEGVQFLQKPFTIESLAEQVREALKQSPGS